MKYCYKCGEELIDTGSKFCPGCGAKLEVSDDHKSVSLKNSPVFYSKDWRQSKAIAIAAIPHFDIFLDKEYFYLLKLPAYSSAAVGALIGFFFGGLGAVVGYFIGESNDTKNRSYLRSRWINSESEIISNEYDKIIFLKIPLTEIKSNLYFNKHKLTIAYNGGKITLKKYIKSNEQLYNYIQNNVL